MNNSNRNSSYLENLPVILRGNTEASAGWLERFLKVFEKILTEPLETPVKLENLPEQVKFPDDLKERINYIPDQKYLVFQGEMTEAARDRLLQLTPDEAYQKAINELYLLSRSLGQILDAIELYFDPVNTPSEFADWLAERLGLISRQNWTPAQKRAAVARIIPLYRIRGTRRGLEEYLKIYVSAGAGESVTIIDELEPMQVEEKSCVGVDTVIDGLPRFFFIVSIVLATPDPRVLKEKKKMIEELIDLEKPVHTYYKIKITIPTLQIDRYSTVDVDTLLWEES